MEIKVPFLKAEVGAGDLVKSAAEIVGIRQSGDCGCRKRQAALNSRLRFVPSGLDPHSRPKWTTPDRTPEGWGIIEECGASRLYTNGRSFAVWTVENGRLTKYHGNCCSKERAREELRQRCR